MNIFSRFTVISITDNKILNGTKIVHGIKFYSFMVDGRAIKLKSVNFYYCVIKIVSCFDFMKFKICQLSLSLNNLDEL